MFDPIGYAARIIQRTVDRWKGLDATEKDLDHLLSAGYRYTEAEQEWIKEHLNEISDYISTTLAERHWRQIFVEAIANLMPHDINR